MMRKTFNREGLPLAWQYFLSYLVVMLALILALYFFTYNSFYAYHREILLGNYAKEIALIGERNNSELSQLVDAANQLSASSDVSPFRFTEAPEKSFRLKQQLAAYKASNDFFLNMYLLFDADDYVYSSSSSFYLDDFLHSAAILGKMGPEELESAMRDTRRLRVAPEQSVQGYMLSSTFVTKQMVPVFVPFGYSTGARIGTILYMVEGDTYRKLFDSIAPGNKDIYILDGETVIISREVAGLPQAAVIQALQTIPEGESTAQLRHDGKDYLLISFVGGGMEYEYAMVVPDDEMKLAFAGSMQGFVILMTVISALCLLVITRFIQSRIKPIRVLQSMILDREPSGNELLAIRDGVQKLIDENAVLNSQMESVESLRKSEFARRFLTGDFDSLDECLAEAETIHLNMDTEYYVVCILAKPQSAEYELYPAKLNRLFDDQVSGVCRTLGLEAKVALIAFGNTREELFAWLDNKFAGIRALCVGATMAVSAAHKHYAEGQHAYLEAETAFENRFVRGNAAIIRFDRLEERQAVAEGYSPQIIDRLSLALRAGDGQRVHEALTELSAMMRTMNTSLFTFRCLYNDILNVVAPGMREGLSQENAGQAYDLFSLSQCLSLDDLDAMLHEACSQIIRGRMAGETREGHPEIKKAKEIIQQRFSEPGVSVLSIAEEVGIPESRFSAEFKAAFHVTPLEYLTQCRMRQARRLLRETDMPVKDIALECGYYDVSSFNRRFKAYTGMTPQQYRQSTDNGG